MHLLALGALVRGRVPEKAERTEFLQALFDEWKEEGQTRLGPNASAWARLRDGFQRHGAKLREWVLRQVGGAKGGQVGAGMIDLGQIVGDVDSARKRVQVEYAGDCGRDWDGATFRPVLDLMALVKSQCDAAVKEEEAYCGRWLDELDAECGGYTTRDLGTALKAAFAAGMGVSAFSHPRLLDYTLRCEDFINGGVEKLVQTGRGVIGDKARNHQLRLLAQINRKAMEDAEDTWQFARTQLLRADDLLSQKIASAEVENQKEIERKVHAELSALREHLQEMLTDKGNDDE